MAADQSTDNIDAERRAKLRISSGITNVSIRTSPDVDGLLQARFRGDRPVIDSEGNTVTIRSGRTPIHRLEEAIGRRQKPDGEVTISSNRLWDIKISGGMSNITADLQDCRISALAISGGVGSVEIDLPRPSGGVEIQISGGVKDVKLHRPAGIPVAVNARGGVVGLSVDGEQFRPAGRPIDWQTPDFSEAADRYVLNVSGGVSGLKVDVR